MIEYRTFEGNLEILVPVKSLPGPTMHRECANVTSSQFPHEASIIDFLGNIMN